MMRSGSERGAAVVEMAFVSILLIWLVLGIVDMGRAIFTNIALQDAAQAGVLFAAYTDDADEAAVQAAVINSNADLDPIDVTVFCTPVSRTDRDASRVEVTVEHSLQFITPLVGPALGGSLDLSKTAEAERFFECNLLPEAP